MRACTRCGRQIESTTDDATVCGICQNELAREYVKVMNPCEYPCVKCGSTNIHRIYYKEGDKVAKGDTLIVVEAMKMENSINTTKDAIVKKVNVAVGDMVEITTVMVELEDVE